MMPARPAPAAAEVGTAENAAFTVHLSGPIDIPASLELFRRSGDDLIDRWDGETLLRTHPVGAGAQGAVAYACRAAGSLECPALYVTVAEPEARQTIEAAARET